MELSKTIKQIEEFFKKHGNLQHGIAAKHYLKSPFKFYGVKSQYVNEMNRIIKREHKDLSKKDLWSLVLKLWNSDYSEQRWLAVKLLRTYDKYLDKSDLPKVEKMLRQSVNWDQVDDISANVMGPILRKDFRAAKPYLIKWSRDKNFWMRRAALLSQIKLLYLGEGEKELFFNLAKPVLTESNYSSAHYVTDIMDEKMGKFFIRKAIGWVLRSLSHSDPQAVVDFVNQNKEIMSGLTYREGTRRLPVKYLKQLR